MNAIKVSHKPTKCQNCDNTTVVEIVNSHSTEEAYQLCEEGKLILDGYVILDNTAPEYIEN